MQQIQLILELLNDNEVIMTHTDERSDIVIIHAEKN